MTLFLGIRSIALLVVDGMQSQNFSSTDDKMALHSGSCKFHRVCLPACVHLSAGVYACFVVRVSAPMYECALSECSQHQACTKCVPLRIPCVCVCGGSDADAVAAESVAEKEKSMKADSSFH